MLRNPQIKGDLPGPNKMMMVLAIISVVIIIVVIWGCHLAVQEVDMTPMVDSAPSRIRRHFSTAEAIDAETTHFFDMTRWHIPRLPCGVRHSPPSK